ncbi:MAG: DUF790 family protein [Magnetococcus sp. DMHC-8]
MLTRDLLRFDQRNQKIYPRFLDTQNRNWQEVAKALTGVYETGSGLSREELTELTLPIIHAARSPLVAKGLDKLLQDRCTFRETDADLESLRMQVFMAAAQRFHPRQADGQPSGAGSNNLETFREEVARELATTPDDLSARLYADLPARQTLLVFAPPAPEQLLHRYNMALAQGPLWWARQLQIDMDEPDVGVRRQFFRHLKFFRLLARIVRTPTGSFRIQLDGPLSLFENSRKYGILLANFLPAVCALSRWNLQAEVTMPARTDQPAAAGPRAGPAILALDHATGLRSHFTQTGRYVPEEFERFATLFGQAVTDWQIQESPDLLELDKQEWVVPDFSFRHDSGRVVHLELFHRWHATPLQRRLESLTKPRKSRPLLALGVDRFLVKQAEVGNMLAASEWYQQHGFPFNAFPPVKRVASCLEGFLPQPADQTTADPS